MTDDWSALAKALHVRRVELGLGQEDLASRGGPSPATLRKLESGREPAHRLRRRTFLQVDQALCWPLGTSLAVLEGVEPPAGSRSEPIFSTEPRDSLSLADASDMELVARLREVADELARRA